MEVDLRGHGIDSNFWRHDGSARSNHDCSNGTYRDHAVNFNLPDAILILERTPAVFRSMLSGLPENWIAANEGPSTFSPFDNVGHLIHGERADWIPRAQLIRAQGAQRRFAPYDRFARVRESQGKSLS